MQYTVRDKLLEVDRMLEGCLGEWLVGLRPQLDVLTADPHWQALRMSTLAVHQVLGNPASVGASLTTMFSLVYLADSLHGLVRNEAEGQEHDQNLQYWVLMGDYLFGRALAMLGEIHCQHLMPYLARMICEVNEGRALEVSNSRRGTGVPDVVSRRQASFFKYSFVTAGVLRGMSAENLKLLGEIGADIGMIVAGKALGWADLSQRMLGLGHNIQSLVSKGYGEPGPQTMKRLVDDIVGFVYDNKAVAVG